MPGVQVTVSADSKYMLLVQIVAACILIVIFVVPFFGRRWRP